MLNHVQEGKRLAIYNASPTATLLAGVPVVVSGHIRIPIANISPLSWGEASAEEVFNLPAKNADTWVDGATLYWDSQNGYLTVTPGGSGVALAGSSVPQESSSAGAQTNTAGKAVGVTTANVKLIDHDEGTPVVPQPTVAAVAAQTQDALTTTGMTGVANTAPAAETNLDTLTDSTEGEAGTEIVALQAGGTGAAAGAFDTAQHRDDFIGQVADNFASLAAQLAKQKALNTVLLNDCKSFAVELNKAKADMAACMATIAALRTALINGGVIAGA
ncbi:MAG: DUF2190 family protein [Candidatus Brocadiia bacterium]|jgi:predicted RecA/RadA family phage recombinase